MTFTAGAVAAGALTYALFGTLRLLRWPSWPLRGLALAAVAGALVWHLRGRQRVPWGRESVQARRSTAERGWWGLVYFGALLGAGFLTEMATPMVLAGAIMATTQGVSWGLWYGAAFGIGRSVPAWVAALHRTGTPPPSAVVAVMTEANRRRGRWLGAVVAAMSLLLIVAELTGVATDRVS